MATSFHEIDRDWLLANGWMVSTEVGTDYFVYTHQTLSPDKGLFIEQARLAAWAYQVDGQLNTARHNAAYLNRQVNKKA